MVLFDIFFFKQTRASIKLHVVYFRWYAARKSKLKKSYSVELVYDDIGVNERSTSINVRNFLLNIAVDVPSLSYYVYRKSMPFTRKLKTSANGHRSFNSLDSFLIIFLRFQLNRPDRVQRISTMTLGYFKQSTITSLQIYKNN